MTIKFTEILYILLLLQVLLSESITEWSVTLKNSTTFDREEAMRCVGLSAAAYCDKNTLKTRIFNDLSKGFTVTYIISDPDTNTQGYIGYLPSVRSIYVVFRGSTNIENWVIYLSIDKVPYKASPPCHCHVHKGFYTAEQSVINDVIAEVRRLLRLLEGYQVTLTGHSLGAALAQLASIDLAMSGLHSRVYNFGQPRVGDRNYATLATSTVPTWRVTHHRDVVPHLPQSLFGLDFAHACMEEFEDEKGVLRTCDHSNDCEDQTCADRYSLLDTNINDHLTYLGVRMACDDV